MEFPQRVSPDILASLGITQHILSTTQPGLIKSISWVDPGKFLVLHVEALGHGMAEIVLDAQEISELLKFLKKVCGEETTIEDFKNMVA